jgi:peptidyl-tRNA hydrolase
LVGSTTAGFRFSFFLDQNLILAHVGIGRPPGQMDPKAFVLQKFNKTGRERVYISNALHVIVVYCYVHLSCALVLNETNLETPWFVLLVDHAVHSH